MFQVLSAADACGRAAEAPRGLHRPARGGEEAARGGRRRAAPAGSCVAGAPGRRGSGGGLGACAAPGARRGRGSRAPWRRRPARPGRPGAATGRGPRWCGPRRSLEQVASLEAFCGIPVLERVHSAKELCCLNRNPECCLCCSGRWKFSKSSWEPLGATQGTPGTPGTTRPLSPARAVSGGHLGVPTHTIRQPQSRKQALDSKGGKRARGWHRGPSPHAS